MKCFVQLITVVEVEIDDTKVSPDKIDDCAMQSAMLSLYGTDVERMVMRTGTGVSQAEPRHKIAVVIEHESVRSMQ